MDFEEELEANVVRKISREDIDKQNQKNIPRTRTKYKLFDYIPLTLKHLSTLQQDSWKEQNVITMFNGRIHFKSCMIYCTVVNKTERGERYIYMVDDGTESMDICSHRKLMDLNAILKLENEVNAIQQETHAQNTDETVKVLRNLLLASRKQLQSTANINAGSRILVVGRPSCYRENVYLDAFHILKDDSPYRHFEIAFKDELIDWYTKNILCSQK